MKTLRKKRKRKWKSKRIIWYEELSEYIQQRSGHIVRAIKRNDKIRLNSGYINFQKHFKSNHNISSIGCIISTINNIFKRFIFFILFIVSHHIVLYLIVQIFYFIFIIKYLHHCYFFDFIFLDHLFQQSFKKGINYKMQRNIQ
jgi:hypothetical protein